MRLPECVKRRGSELARELLCEPALLRDEPFDMDTLTSRGEAGENEVHVLVFLAGSEQAATEALKVGLDFLEAWEHFLDLGHFLDHSFELREHLIVEFDVEGEDFVTLEPPGRRLDALGEPDRFRCEDNKVCPPRDLRYVADVLFAALLE